MLSSYSLIPVQAPLKCTPCWTSKVYAANGWILVVVTATVNSVLYLTQPDQAAGTWAHSLSHKGSHTLSLHHGSSNHLVVLTKTYQVAPVIHTGLTGEICNKLLTVADRHCTVWSKMVKFLKVH